MSKEKKRNPQPIEVPAEVVLDPGTPDAAPSVNANGVPLGSVVPVPVPAPVPRLMDVDRMALELARQRRQTALAEAKTALAQNDNAELAYKYVVLQLYMKYGLTDADAISEAGEIVKGGALPQNQQKQ
jgi:hypothetical protein